MRARATLSVNFYCRESKAGKTGEAPVELGVNVDGTRFFVNLPRRCKPRHLGRMREYTSAIEGRIRDYELWCLEKGKRITADGVKEFIRNGFSVPQENIGYWLREFMSYTEGKDIRNSVKVKHRLVVNQFLEVNKITPEDTMDRVTPGAIRTYMEYLDANYKKSTAAGMLQKLKGALQYAVEHHMMSQNPFTFKIKRYTPEIETIDDDEYERIKNLDLSYCERLERVRDLFVFSCNTGLAYCDTQDLGHLSILP